MDEYALLRPQVAYRYARRLADAAGYPRLTIYDRTLGPGPEEYLVVDKLYDAALAGNDSATTFLRALVATLDTIVNPPPPDTCDACGCPLEGAWYEPPDGRTLCRPDCPIDTADRRRYFSGRAAA